MGGFGYMDKSTGKIGYVMYDKSRTQNGIRPNMRNRLWRAVDLWKEGHLEKILTWWQISIRTELQKKKLLLSYMKKYAGGSPEVFFLNNSRKIQTKMSFLHRNFLNRESIGQDCLLITTASHVRRSLKCFSKQGIDMDYSSIDARKPLMVSGN